MKKLKRIEYFIKKIKLVFEVKYQVIKKRDRDLDFEIDLLELLKKYNLFAKNTELAHLGKVNLTIAVNEHPNIKLEYFLLDCKENKNGKK